MIADNLVGVSAIAYSAHRQLLVVGCQDGHIHIWGTALGKFTKQMKLGPFHNRVAKIVAARDRPVAVLIEGDRALRLLDL